MMPTFMGPSLRPGLAAGIDAAPTARCEDGRMVARWMAGLAVAVLAALGACGGGSEARPAQHGASVARAARAQPSAPSLRDHLAALQRIASAHGGTRAAGTPGDTATAEYLQERLRAAGLRVRTQRVTFPFTAERTPPQVTRVDGPDRRLRPNRDVRTQLYSGPADVEARVRAIQVRPGRTTASGCRPGAFAALRPGEIALVQRGVCTLRRKALNAQRAGAAAVLILNDGVGGRTGPFAGTLGGPGARIAVLGLSSQAGAALARASRPRLRVRVRSVSETRTTHNVIAELGDPTPRRIVMAGAHIDSVPAGPGINDNGSGTSAVLDSAEALARTRLPDGVQLRFGFWGAEELGLFGSRHYVAGLDRAARRAHAAYLNLDMVGTPGGSRGVYVGTDPAGRRIERLLRVALGGRIRPERLGGSSDHASFRRAGIPVGGLFTGLDRCYHRRCDTLRNVDVGLAEQMARALRSALRALIRS
jgi:hypothetical protein